MLRNAQNKLFGRKITLDEKINPQDLGDLLDILSVDTKVFMASRLGIYFSIGWVEPKQALRTIENTWAFEQCIKDGAMKITHQIYSGKNKNKHYIDIIMKNWLYGTISKANLSYTLKKE